MTKIILEHGGDVTFETAWHKENCWPGFAGKKGNALDYVKDLRIKRKSSNNYDDLMSMLSKQKVTTKF